MNADCDDLGLECGQLERNPRISNLQLRLASDANLGVKHDKERLRKEIKCNTKCNTIFKAWYSGHGGAEANVDAAFVKYDQ